MNTSEKTNLHSSTTLRSSIMTNSSTISLSKMSKSVNELSSKNQCLGRTIHNKFFMKIIKNEKNWSAKCLICDETVFVNIGVTSNVNRHVKINHRIEHNE